MSIGQEPIWTDVAIALLLILVGVAAAVWFYRAPRHAQKNDPDLHLDALFSKYSVRGEACGLLGSRLEFAGRRYNIGPTDRRAFAFLKSVVERRRGPSLPGIPGTRLVEYRQDFRSISSLKPIAGLVACLKSDDRELRLLGIWLLGRCERASAVGAVSKFLSDADTSVRWRVAHALCRMRGFVELHAMAREDVDLRVRQLAERLSAYVDRTYTTRLRRFVCHAGPAPARQPRHESHMPMFILQPIDRATLPKTRAWIRRILEHIRQLVRGRRNNGTHGARRIA